MIQFPHINTISILFFTVTSFTFGIFLNLFYANSKIFIFSAVSYKLFTQFTIYCSTYKNMKHHTKNSYAIES